MKSGGDTAKPVHYYFAKTNDSLAKIAEEFCVPLSEIKSDPDNQHLFEGEGRKKDGSLIHKGDRISIPFGHQSWRRVGSQWYCTFEKSDGTVVELKQRDKPEER